MKVLVFTSNNRRTHEVDEARIEEFKALHPGCVVNPDLSRVRGIDPHFTKAPKSGNVIEKMNERERAAVIESHFKNGVDNGSGYPIPKAARKRIRIMPIIPWTIAAVEAAAIIILLVSR